MLDRLRVVYDQQLANLSSSNIHRGFKSMQFRSLWQTSVTLEAIRTSAMADYTAPAVELVVQV